MTRLFLISFTTGVLASGTLLLAQDRQPRSDNPTQVQAGQTTAGATMGKVKEYTPGKKIEVDVDNAPDKSYDLADKDTTVNVAANVKTGDTVQIMERTVNGKKMVDITPSSAPAKK